MKNENSIQMERNDQCAKPVTRNQQSKWANQYRSLDNSVATMSEWKKERRSENIISQEKKWEKRYSCWRYKEFYVKSRDVYIFFFM